MKVFRALLGVSLVAVVGAVAIFSANLRSQGVALSVSNPKEKFVAKANCFHSSCDCQKEQMEQESGQVGSGGNVQETEMGGRKLDSGSDCKIPDLDVSSLSNVRICPTFGGSTPSFSAGILTEDGDPQFLIFGYGSLSLARFHGIVDIKYQGRMYTPCDLKSLFHFARFMRQVF